MSKGKVTLASVAKEAGVTAQTASKVINGGQSTTNVSEPTKKKVLEAAKRLGYRPNTLARAIRQGRIGSLGMLVSMDSHRSYLPADFIFGIVAEAEKNGTDIKLIHYNEETDIAKDTPRFLREVMVDGLLVNYFDNSDATLALMDDLVQRQIPTIWLNKKIPVDSVYFDDYNAGRELAKMIQEKGAKYPVYIDISDKVDVHYSRSERPRGFADQLKEDGIDSIITLETVPYPDQLDFLRGFFKANPQLDAIACYGFEAFTPIMQVITESGKKAEKDFILGSFGTNDHIPMYPRVTMVQENRLFGEVAVKMLIQKLKNPNTPLPSQIIEFTRGKKQQ